MVPFVKFRDISQYHISSIPFGSSPTLAQVFKLLACLTEMTVSHRGTNTTHPQGGCSFTQHL